MNRGDCAAETARAEEGVAVLVKAALARDGVRENPSTATPCSRRLRQSASNDLMVVNV
jgi:hypothetical protein